MELGCTVHPDRGYLASPPPAGANGQRQALEAIVRIARPRQSKEIAGKLLDRFGSLGDVLAAGRVRRRAILSDLPDVELALQSLHQAMLDMLSGDISNRPVLSSDRAVLDYLKVHMAFERIEHFRVMFLNAANGLLADEEFASGTVASVHAYPREILRRCLELDATALLLIHNHPSGDPVPSRDDRVLTDRIVRAAAIFDVRVHDHLIVAKNGTMSFRRAGYL